ncbi:hypothetical protein VOLCADRAFT_104482 [Volvox carteri f. nagariensis]|uniref:Uncharacterized protein n=1 Tax=Volvox carteri f. nagariensis TaxID=3068 RepID=D8TTW3_VOLCA|nr:uncharacterized protein VOLCADRAFT_104482 [Volvox carteri f. nagariensis]EFJ49037.1 hypothetical protein VOLCADRAFT_104482 [Volvox carteri f. nagariensis]|eukprot:XP_002949934.1 hypothetical protein VOLCADRAFT_104482 [Volvox carteri f. nagariensis]
MNGYKTAEQLLRQQNSTKAHEAQLLDARKQRKETDGQLQRSSKSLNSDVGGAGGVSAPSAPPPGALGHPPRAPSASRARPPAVLAGRGSDKANKLPPADGAAAAAAVATTSARRHSADVPSIAAAAATATLPHSRSASGKSSSRPAVAATATAEEDGRVLLSGASTGPLAASLLSLSSSSSSGPNHIAGLQQLSGTQQYSTDSDLAQGLGGSGGAAAGRSGAMTLIHGGSELAAAELPTALSSGGSGGAAYSGRNTMTVIHGAAQAAGELDGEVIEELQRGGRSGGGGTGGNGGEGPSGLQEFATESGRKVVVVKASRKPEGTAAATAVSAAGVGWGMGGRSAGGAAPIAPLEARQLQAEMAKKQQIWKVRKTFGLEPTPLSDRSAQVEELGAGAWQ